jgi:hypothetical protein
MIAPHSSGNGTSRNVVKVALPSLEGAHQQRSFFWATRRASGRGERHSPADVDIVRGRASTAARSQYLMTTRPSILPCFISSKIVLISSSRRVDTVGWMSPRA